ncbi:ABC transporter ATP-binding protein [soil metagenome]
MAAAGAPISVKGLTHAFRSGSGSVSALDGVDLEVPAGGYASLIGASGAGKTTLLAILGGLEPPQRGSVLVGDIDLASLKGDGLARYRRTTVGFVFQHFGLIGTLSAMENVELASILTCLPRRARRARTLALLHAVGLGQRTTHKPGELSGGERQRVAIARALANEPRLILADEPTGNLDEASARGVIELLEQLHAERGCTVLVVTHNRAIACRASQQIALTRGRIVSASNDLSADRESSALDRRSGSSRST